MVQFLLFSLFLDYVRFLLDLKLQSSRFSLGRIRQQVKSIAGSFLAARNRAVRDKLDDFNTVLADFVRLYRSELGRQHIADDVGILTIKYTTCHLEATRMPCLRFFGFV